VTGKATIAVTANAVGNTFAGGTIGGGAMLLIGFLDDHAQAVGATGIILSFVLQWYFKRKSNKRAEELHKKAMEKV